MQATLESWERGTGNEAILESKRSFRQHGFTKYRYVPYAIIRKLQTYSPLIVNLSNY